MMLDQTNSCIWGDWGIGGLVGSLWTSAASDADSAASDAGYSPRSSRLTPSCLILYDNESYTGALPMHKDLHVQAFITTKKS